MKKIFFLILLFSFCSSCRKIYKKTQKALQMEESSTPYKITQATIHMVNGIGYI